MITGCFLDKVLKLMLQTCCYRSGQSRLVSIGELSIRLYLVVLGVLGFLPEGAVRTRGDDPSIVTHGAPPGFSVLQSTV